MRRQLVAVLFLTACGGSEDLPAIDAGTTVDAPEGLADVAPILVLDAEVADSVTSGSECLADEIQSLVCTNGEGTEFRTCVEGHWGPWSTDCTPTFTTVEMGFIGGCGVKEDGTAACDPGYAPLEGAGWVSVVGSLGEFCGLKTDGTVGCKEITAPTGTFKAIAMDDDKDEPTFCGIKSDDTVGCWGQVDPAFPSGTYQQIDLAKGIACGIKSDGTIACAGHDFDVPSGTFLELSVGSRTLCAIRSDGSLVCATDDPATAPALAQVPSGTFTKVSTNGTQACAVRADETIACWGWETMGSTWPPAGAFDDVDLEEGACGLTTAGHLECWGTDCGAIPLVGTENACETCGPIPECQCGGVTFDCDRGCDDGDNDKADAVTRPATDDGVDDYTAVSGTLGQNDSDWFAIPVSDESFSVLTGDLRLTPTAGQTLLVCLSFRYGEVNETYFYGCARASNDTPVVHERGLGGLGFGDDSGTALVQVIREAGPRTCAGYTLEYRF
jgi:hypothetical protein